MRCSRIAVVLSLCSGLFATTIDLTDASAEGACCTPAQECIDDQTVDECTDAGNAFAGEGVTCADRNGAVCGNLAGACCEDDGCNFRKFPECALAGGRFVGHGTTCDANICAPPPPRGACCHAGGCAQTSEANCTGDGYHWSGPGTACIEGTGQAQCPDQVACCIDNQCSEVAIDVCDANGVNVGTCADPSPSCDAPPPITGACCGPEGCTDGLTEEACGRSDANTWAGADSTCDTAGVCGGNEDIGACCSEDDDCENITARACTEKDGDWQSGVRCEPGGTEPGPPQSTGFDNHLIGNWTNTGIIPIWNPSPAPANPALTTAPIDYMTYVQWMSINEPESELDKYYYQSLFAAIQTAERGWQCAGDQGNRLSRIFSIRFGNDVLDPDLAGVNFGTFAQFRSAIVASSFYDVPADADFDTIYGIVTGAGGGGNFFGSNGSAAGSCFEAATVERLICPEAPPVTGACCIASVCTDMTVEACREKSGLYFGDGSECVEDQCPVVDEPIVTACCVPDGQCLDLQQAECYGVGGMPIQNESCVDAVAASGGTMVSTGLDSSQIGNLDIGPNSPILRPNVGDTPSTLADFLQWMSTNDPGTPFGTYYYQTTMPAIQTAATNWQCAGDQGFRLRKTFSLTLQDVMDPALVGTNYNTIDDLRAALSASTLYGAVTTTSTWDEIHATLVDVNEASNLLYSVSGQLAQDCFTVETAGFECPQPQACCLDGACFDLNQRQCEARGGQIVGNDCDDDDIVCEGEDPGACCVEGACVEVGIEVCEERYGGFFYADTNECIERCEAIIGGCCLPDGTCIDMAEYKCLTSGGSWLGADQSCQDVTNGSAAGGNIVSTGLNNLLIGNLGTGYTAPVLYPLGSVVTSTDDYLQWISVNEANTNFRTYYYQSTVAATQTAAANWQCAGDQGNKLTKTYMIKLFDVPDAALAGTTYYNFIDLRTALLGSTPYGALTANADWNAVRTLLLEIGSATPDGLNDAPYGIYGQNAQDCFTIEEADPLCPSPAACCIDGACFDMTEAECAERGGQVVGSDCDEDDLVCEPVVDPTGACCTPDGRCNESWDERHCDLANGTWLSGQSCDADEDGEAICPQPETIACCVQGACFDMTAAECEERAGQNVGAACGDDDIICGTPEGACCTPDGQCAVIAEEKCRELQGTYSGDDSSCDDVTCTPTEPGPCGGDDDVGPPDVPVDDDEPNQSVGGAEPSGDPIGACCKGDTCSEQTAGQCARTNGLWGGPGSTCDDRAICQRVNGTSSGGNGGCQSTPGESMPIWALLLLFGLYRRRTTRVLAARR